jgi:acetyl esterase/lipase
MTDGPPRFVLDVPTDGTVVDRHPRFDVYRPEITSGPLPTVVFVHGPVPAQVPVRPRDWPFYQGYGRLAASRGIVGVVLDLPYYGVSDWPTVGAELPALLESVRELDIVAAGRTAVWAFSGGGLLVRRWLALPPAWLRCLALTYPVLRTDDMAPPEVRPGVPVVLTRVGRELPERQVGVDEFLALAAEAGMAVSRIDVPDGEHGFDAGVPTESARQAVVDAFDAVVEVLGA